MERRNSDENFDYTNMHDKIVIGNPNINKVKSQKLE